jgi:hypothetical protein
MITLEQTKPLALAAGDFCMDQRYPPGPPRTFGFVCTRAYGHDDLHVAHMPDGRAAAAWHQEDRHATEL